jgi:hypothetical protein
MAPDDERIPFILTARDFYILGIPIRTHWSATCTECGRTSRWYRDKQDAKQWSNHHADERH